MAIDKNTPRRPTILVDVDGIPNNDWHIVERLIGYLSEADVYLFRSWEVSIPDWEALTCTQPATSLLPEALNLAHAHLPRLLAVLTAAGRPSALIVSGRSRMSDVLISHARVLLPVSFCFLEPQQPEETAACMQLAKLSGGGGVLPLHSNLDEVELYVLSGFLRPSEVADTSPPQEQINSPVSIPFTWRLPAASLLPALCDSSPLPTRRWSRGLRVFRNEVLKVKDCLFEDSGSIGLELERALDISHDSSSDRGPDWQVVGEPVWRVRQTFPPSSALGLIQGAKLIGINGALPPSHAIALGEILIKVRPVLVTIEDGKAQNKTEESSLKLSCLHACAGIAQVIAAHVLEKRVVKPFKSIPKKFELTPRDGEPAEHPGKEAEANSSPTSDHPIRFDPGLLSLSLGFLPTNFCSLSPLGVLEPSALATLIEDTDSVTPAMFAVDPDVAKRLRIEGFPSELLYVFWRLKLEWSQDSGTDQAVLSLRDLPKDSTILLAIFVTRIVDSCRPRMPEMAELCKRVIGWLSSDTTSADLDEAQRIPITREWMQTWEESENKVG